MRTPSLLFLALLSLLSCTDPIRTADGRSIALLDTTHVDLEGEYTPGKDSARLLLCGTVKHYLLAGSVLAELAQRYTHVHTTPGSPVKVWITAQWGLAGADSVIVGRSVMHMDATLRCPPVPSGLLAGHYRATLPGTFGHTRIIDLDLFADGSTSQLLDQGDGSVASEEEGDWGMESSGQLRLHWPKRDAVQYYIPEGTGLNSAVEMEGRPAVVFQRTGEADRFSGTFGEVVHLLAQVATDHHVPCDPGTLRKGTSLKEVFLSGTDTALADLRERAKAAYAIPQEVIDKEWVHAETVGHVVELVRAAKRVPH